MEDLLAEQEMGRWRRTHYSSNIEPSINDSEVVVMGWVSSIRDHGNIQFIMLKDRLGDIQIVGKSGECTDIVFKQMQNLKDHSSIAVRGKVKSQRKAPNGAEVVPVEIKVFSKVKNAAPFMVHASTGSVGIDTRLDLRAVDLRRNTLQSVFRIRHSTLIATRDFLASHGFLEVSTPKMISTATEGGAALFPIFYYDRQAFLAQSPQLYKEQLTMAFENVYEIGPIFRAEPSRTNRHLSEATSVDVEMAFVDYNDVMELLERMIAYTMNTIVEKNKIDLSSLKLIFPKLRLPFPRYTYDGIIQKLQTMGEKIRWGDDISPQSMKNLTYSQDKEIRQDKEDIEMNRDGEKSKDLPMNAFYFITDWPTSIKPFYAKANPGFPNISESFDLMYGQLEVASGSTRINRKDELIDRMRKQGITTETFDYHLRVFDYGVPPHAGFGVGLERLLMAITRVDNIRDVTMYPRDIDRLTP